MGLGEINTPLLNIKNLTVAYRQAGVWLEAVREVSFSISAGETYGLVGESGSGKTTLVLAIMRYLGVDGTILDGVIQLDGQDLCTLNYTKMRDIWGRKINMVPQNPQSALNPSIRVGEQLAEIFRYHQKTNPADARRQALEYLEMVHIADSERIAQSYPHQISGGMQQRVMIAMALSTEPRLLIFDEPTTSLDVTTQSVILDLVRELIKGKQTAALYVTHNLGVVAKICDRVGVMYAGDLVEEASAKDLYRKPLHPYTRGLLDSVPRLGETKNQFKLRAITGQIPPIGERPSGCVFRPRCPLVIEACYQRPDLFNLAGHRRARCHRWDEIKRGEVDARQPAHQMEAIKPIEGRQSREILKIEGLKVYFPLPRSLVRLVQRKRPSFVHAVDGVKLKIDSGQTLGLVGESGSGKTTIARSIMGLVEKTGGDIELLSLPLPHKLSERDLETLRHLQMIFQNPDEALNPYLTVGKSLSRPLITIMGNSGSEVDEQVAKLLEMVQLPASYASRLPVQLSGGEKQRIAIARAFASNPDILVADEPVSSLDVSVQASILNLFNQLQIDYGSSLLFISHNLAVVGYLADRIAVIYLGQLMELSDAEVLFDVPYHPYTEALLSAIPLADPYAKQNQIRLEGDIPSAIQKPPGCPFHTRCPSFLGEICIKETPPWRFDEETGKQYFCHISASELRKSQKRVFNLVYSHPE